MNTKQKLEKHNNKLREKGISYQALDFRGGTNPRSTYVCENGHKFDADRARIVAGKAKCPTCEPAVGRKLTHEAYEDRLLAVEADFFPLEQYRGASTKIKHQCINGHVHEIEPRRVWEKLNGCPYCSGMIKKTTESYAAELLSKGILHTIEEEYTTVMTKTKHKCHDCEHTWYPKPHDVLNGSGCPACAAFGFNRAKPAILYYVKLWDESKTYYKIGVTNGTVERRFKNCGKSYKLLMEKHYERGREAEIAEQMILDEYKESRALAPRWLKTGGNTELFKHDVLLLDVDREPLLEYNEA